MINLLPIRFREKFLITEDNHWLWAASQDKNGYGWFWNSGKMMLAHRAAWELLIGPISEGLNVLHKNFCHTRACVNPEHLYLGNHKQNMEDRIKTGTNPMINKTHCPAGHEYSEENTSIWKNRRSCRLCHRERDNRRNKIRRSNV